MHVFGFSALITSCIDTNARRYKQNDKPSNHGFPDQSVHPITQRNTKHVREDPKCLKSCRKMQLRSTEREQHTGKEVACYTHWLHSKFGIKIYVLPFIRTPLPHTILAPSAAALLDIPQGRLCTPKKYAMNFCLWIWRKRAIREILVNQSFRKHRLDQRFPKCAGIRDRFTEDPWIHFSNG